MMYGGGSIDVDDNGVRGGRIDDGIWCEERMDLILDSLSNLYSELDAI